LYLGLVALVLPLFYYKYLLPFNFTSAHSDVSNHYLGILKLSPSSYLFPLGISYFTYQAISYVLDVYRNKYYPTNNLFLYFAYMSYFPQLLIGPISRFPNLSSQLSANKKFNQQLAIEGLLLICVGLIKKILISDDLSNIFNHFFSLHYSGLQSVIAITLTPCYMFFDFSSYVDMARGISKLFNIEIPRNFDSPLTQKSLTNFWSNWHISLYNWLRDYIFFPLLSLNSKKPFIFFWIIITFSISGIWHGLESRLILSSVFASILVALEAAYKGTKRKHSAFDHFTLSWIKNIYTYGTMSIIFLYYLCPNTNIFFQIFKNITNQIKQPNPFSPRQLFSITLALIFIALEYKRDMLKIKFNNSPTLVKFSAISVVSMILIASYRPNIKPFIYFFS
jgi:D-alanyl-lipoteichoic acid acyltransferase DltB (MBOAT superfamily)